MLVEADVDALRLAVLRLVSLVCWLVEADWLASRLAWSLALAESLADLLASDLASLVLGAWLSRFDVLTDLLKLSTVLKLFDVLVEAALLA